MSADVPTLKAHAEASLEAVIQIHACLLTLCAKKRMNWAASTVSAPVATRARDAQKTWTSVQLTSANMTASVATSRESLSATVDPDTQEHAATLR